uniref:Putative secreted protein n=1 Tax=Panstrongylus lignarius TaxID=156445 RepID=A0A224XP80_9HEMI
MNLLQYSLFTLLLCYIADTSAFSTITDELSYDGPSTYDGENVITTDLENPFGFFLEKLKFRAHPKEIWPKDICHCDAENDQLAVRLMKRLEFEREKNIGQEEVENNLQENNNNTMTENRPYIKEEL